MNRTAPIVRLTLAYAVGVAAGLAGAPVLVAPLGALLGAVLPNPTSRRPVSRSILAVVWAGGLVAGSANRQTGPDCERGVAGESVTLRGRFLAAPRGGSAPFETPDGCGAVTVVVAERDSTVGAGVPVEVTGAWRAGRRRAWMQAQAIARTDHGERVGVSPAAVRWAAVRWRDELVDRLHRLFPRHGPLVSALVLARREGLDPELRASFAVTGIAHLLAISGFHVGLIAGLLYSILRAAGRDRRSAVLAAAGLAWVYVGLIGFPDAAFRAVLILTFAAAARLKGLPPSRWGPLAAAALVLLMLDPLRLTSPGFQLSFAGAAGLVAWVRPFERAIGRGWRTLRSRVGWSLDEPRALTSGLAAGAAATLATAPVVAWHFERLSVVGIPMTLAATPLVSLALPAALLTLVSDFFSGSVASFLAGGTSTLLDILVRLTGSVAERSWVSVWTSRPTVLACLTGVTTASIVARAPRIGRAARTRLLLLYSVAGVIGWPALVALDDRGRLEIVVIDVGQGDAIAMRSPRGRWLLVDAGPPTRDDPGAHPVVRMLRGRGVRRLEALVLTHPDLDHIGGASAVLEHTRPRVIIDPMLPAPKTGYADLIDAARSREIPWLPARTGDRYDVDGVSIVVLHPDELPKDAQDGNSASVVLLVEWHGFRALFTGDAYVDVERTIAAAVGDIDVLKVGHHGSDTSTDSSFLATVRPEVALVSAGRGNRYGHPTAAVIQRLHRAGAFVLRTDTDGTLRVVVRRSGAYEIVSAVRRHEGRP